LFPLALFELFGEQPASIDSANVKANNNDTILIVLLFKLISPR